MPFNQLSTESENGGVSFRMDNDARYFTLLGFDEDRYYSQGMRIVWKGAPKAPAPSQNLLFSIAKGLDAYATSFRWSISQEIYTPNDLLVTPPLIEDDRLFAGWTHLDYSQRFYNFWGNIPARLSGEISLGLVGPASLGDRIQIGFHEMRSKTSRHPELDPNPEKGWKAQYGRNGFPHRMQLHLSQGITPFSIRNEKGIQVELGMESGFRVGQIFGNAYTSFEFQIGKFNHTKYLAKLEKQARQFELYVFGKSTLASVGWNQFLNGNESSSVKLARVLWQNELGITCAGFGILPQVTWAIHVWSRETKRNPQDPFQQGNTDYRPELQDRPPWADHIFGTFQMEWNW